MLKTPPSNHGSIAEVLFLLWITFWSNSFLFLKLNESWQGNNIAWRENRGREARQQETKIFNEKRRRPILERSNIAQRSKNKPFDWIERIKDFLAAEEDKDVGWNAEEDTPQCIVHASECQDWKCLRTLYVGYISFFPNLTALICMQISHLLCLLKRLEVFQKLVFQLWQ